MARYSETLTEHVMSPRNGGIIEGADLIGHAGTLGHGAFRSGKRCQETIQEFFENERNSGSMRSSHGELEYTIDDEIRIIGS